MLQIKPKFLCYAILILNTTIDDNSRYFSVPFAVADIKYNILGTPFFEDNIQNTNIQEFRLEFKYQSKTHPNYANSQHSYLKTTHIFHTFIELIQKLKYVSNPRLLKSHTFQ